VNIYEFGAERRLDSIVSASRADYVRGAWILHQVIITRFQDDGGVSRLQEATLAWRV
jgi:hypothetical protein